MLINASPVTLAMGMAFVPLTIRLTEYYKSSMPTGTDLSVLLIICTPNHRVDYRRTYEPSQASNIQIKRELSFHHLKPPPQVLLAETIEHLPMQSNTLFVGDNYSRMATELFTKLAKSRVASIRKTLHLIRFETPQPPTNPTGPSIKLLKPRSCLERWRPS